MYYTGLLPRTIAGRPLVSSSLVFFNDVASGMRASQQSGGYCIVQDPDEAEYPDMPLAVLESIEADYCVQLAAMGKVILDIMRKGKTKEIVLPVKIAAESKLSEQVATGIDRLSSPGQKTTYSCPDCGGRPWQINGGHDEHYRCYIGHACSEKGLIIKQAEGIESTLWIALRIWKNVNYCWQKWSAKMGAGACPGQAKRTRTMPGNWRTTFNA